MNIFACFVLFFLVSLPAFARDLDFYIEDPTLTPLPKSVEKAIREKPNGYQIDSCVLIGKTIDLSDEDSPTYYIATAAVPCQAHVGPIWLVRHSRNANEIILNSISYSLELKQTNTNGLYDITTSWADTHDSKVEFWYFDGTQYKKNVSYHFTTSDPGTCKIHKDICPFATDKKK